MPAKANSENRCCADPVVTDGTGASVPILKIVVDVGVAVIRLYLTEDEAEMLEKGLKYLGKSAGSEKVAELVKSVGQKLYAATNSGKEKDGYLEGLTEGAAWLYKEFLRLYDVNLYHSVSAVMENMRQSGRETTVETVFEQYIKKNQHKRPIILDHQQNLLEMIEHVYSRLTR